MKHPCVYILASKANGTLYIGVTGDLYGRMADHKQGLIDGFTKKHAVTRLVYYEMHETMDGAIRREKQLKKWNACGSCASSRRSILSGWTSLTRSRENSATCPLIRRELQRNARSRRVV